MKHPLLCCLFMALSVSPLAFGDTSIRVRNSEELYEAVDNINNAAKTIQLRAGLYTLTPRTPLGVDRAHAGRLELQPGMSLVGVPGDPRRVIIDASALPGASYAIPPLTGAIRLGRGRNTVEWLTVQNAVNGAAAIETDLEWTGAVHLRIAHLIVKNNQRGIDVRNIGPANAGRILAVDIKSNILYGNVQGQGQGLRISNANGADGSAIRAKLRGNYSQGNLVGCLVGNSSTQWAAIEVESVGNHFSNNGIGCTVLGGASLGGPVAVGNSVKFDSWSDTFAGNQTETPAFGLPGGIVAVAGVSDPAGSASDNTLRVHLRNARFRRNQRPDINAFGAFSPDVAIPAGTGNSTVLLLESAGRRIKVSANASSPPDDSGSNIVKVIRR